MFLQLLLVQLMPLFKVRTRILILIRYLLFAELAMLRTLLFITLQLVAAVGGDWWQVLVLQVLVLYHHLFRVLDFRLRPQG